MNITTDPNLWAICALVFVLGRKKWKTRYNSEVERRRELERAHAEREKEWRERDSLRAAAIRDPREPGDGEIRGV